MTNKEQKTKKWLEKLKKNPQKIPKYDKLEEKESD
jgi:hypothetical protein